MAESGIKSLEDIRKSVAEQIAKASTQDELVAGVVGLVSKYCFEVELVKRRLAALESLQRAKDKILTRYAAKPEAPLPQFVTIEAREALSADGFHELEYDGNTGVAFRWTGPSKFSRFLVWLDRSAEIIVRFDIADGGDARNFEEMTLTVDGKSYGLKQDLFPNSFLSDLIPSVETVGPTEIVLCVPFLFRPSDNGEADARALGVRFLQLSVGHIED
jgi:hypothetical protein